MVLATIFTKDITWANHFTHIGEITPSLLAMGS
jgi:hypothetical protein